MTLKDPEPILKRIGINGQKWYDLVWNFEKYFGRGSAAGSPKSLKKSASKRIPKLAPGQNAVASCFVGLRYVQRRKTVQADLTRFPCP